MTKEDTITRIIESRIKNIVCIDDDYATPYNDTSVKIEKEIYNSLTLHSNGFVRMIKYSDSITGIKDILDLTDLLVLDWELDAQSEGRQFEPTLKLLDEVINSNCPFICIYTREKELLPIHEIIYRYYLSVSKRDIKSMSLKLNAIGLDLAQINTIVQEYVIQSDESKFMKFFGNLMKTNHAFIKEQFGDDISAERFKKIVLRNYIYNKYENLIQSSLSDINIAYICKGNEIISININGKILTVFAKNIDGEKKEANHKLIAPDKLFTTFASTICSAPNNIYNALWMDYQNNLRTIVYNSQSSFLQKVSDKMLLKLKNKVEKENDNQDGRAFEKELINHFNEDLVHQLYNLELSIDDSVKQKIEKAKGPSPSDVDYVYFNVLYSQNRNRINMKNQIRFGDMFYVSGYVKDINGNEADDSASYLDIKGKILLCITAHCDCSHTKPGAKIRNNFDFAIGTAEDNPASALKDPEAGKYELCDFILHKGEGKAVKWDSYFTKIFIESLDLNEEGCLLGVYKGCIVKIEFIGNLKENYTQRIANRLYSHANRVGITYLGKDD